MSMTSVLFLKNRIKKNISILLYTDSGVVATKFPFYKIQVSWMTWPTRLFYVSVVGSVGLLETTVLHVLFYNFLNVLWTMCGMKYKNIAVTLGMHMRN